KHKLKP
ncbi:hypothetical protein TSUD_394300, partial [Trifolium subterraneum]